MTNNAFGTIRNSLSGFFDEAEFYRKAMRRMAFHVGQ